MFRSLGLLLVICAVWSFAEHEQLLCGWLGPLTWEYVMYCYFALPACDFPVILYDTSPTFLFLIFIMLTMLFDFLGLSKFLVNSMSPAIFHFLCAVFLPLLIVVESEHETVLCNWLSAQYGSWDTSCSQSASSCEFSVLTITTYALLIKSRLFVSPGCYMHDYFVCNLLRD